MRPGDSQLDGIKTALRSIGVEFTTPDADELITAFE
jgi:hypothetical protein